MTPPAKFKSLLLSAATIPLLARAPFAQAVNTGARSTPWVLPHFRFPMRAASFTAKYGRRPNFGHAMVCFSSTALLVPALAYGLFNGAIIPWGGPIPGRGTWGVEASIHILLCLFAGWPLTFLAHEPFSGGQPA